MLKVMFLAVAKLILVVLRYMTGHSSVLRKVLILPLTLIHIITLK